MAIPSPSIPLSPGGFRDFRIMVSVTGPPSHARATVSSVLENAAHPEKLQVVGTAGVLQEVREGLPEAGLVDWLEAERSPETAEIVRSSLRLAPCRDIILLRPGILLPPLFDLRLQWSAYSDEAVGAVSPLSDVEPLTSLSRHGINGRHFSELDRFLAAAGLPRAVDAPFILPECSYLRWEHLPPPSSSSLGLGTRGLADDMHRRGVLTAIAPHVVVGAGEIPRRTQPIVTTERARVFIAESPLHRVARAYFAMGQEDLQVPTVDERVRPRVLLVMHSLGGGLDYWARVYSEAASAQETLILKSIGERGRFGSQLWLYDDIRSKRPVRVWKLPSPIAGTAVHHLGYESALQEILEDFGVDRVIVASLIGHSLDLLRSGRRTLHVCHDYYPFCPALHIHYGEVCQRCEPDRMQRCLIENPLHEIFDNRDPVEWMTLRKAFVAALRDFNVQMVAPSNSVRRHYCELGPELKNVPFEVIPHGDSLDAARPLPTPEPSKTGRLRIVVPGRLSYAKGSDLFREVARKTQEEADFFLIGAGGDWKREAPRGVTVIPDYQQEQIESLLGQIQPDLALLLSIVPETFSFTLGECFQLAVPPLATRVGSFEDRIDHGVTGFLCEPDAERIAEQIRKLHADSRLLDGVRSKLRRRPVRTPEDMAKDYEGLMDLPRWSERAYFSRQGHARQKPHPESSRGGDGFQLPPSSPLGFMNFLAQVEEGVEHHLRLTQRLRPWQKSVLGTVSRFGFGFTRRLIDLF